MTKPSLFVKRACTLFAAALILASTALAQPADAPKKKFNIPAGNADTTLKLFSEQSGEQIVYPVDKLHAIETKAVSGDLTGRDALVRMLADSGFVVVQDEKTGALAVRPVPVARVAEASNRAAGPVAAAASPTSKAAASAEQSAETPLVLTPFEVNASGDRGYLATSTLSGTRLNSKLEDLAASISVVTKQQLTDTASTDINDVFMYEAGTEGIYQFTAFTVDRGVVSDDISANPHGATRMRGLTSANVATNGFSTTLPFDTYNVDQVEISRGPNSSIFGLGNSGGGVNIVGSKANTNRDITSFGTRGDSYGGYRANFDINRSVAKDKFGVRVLGVYEEKGFEREPSADTTRRLQAAMTLRPFKNTTLRGSFESYRNFNSRPNSTTPRDMFADWIANGRPTWDPSTQTVNFRSGASSIGPITTGTGGNEGTLLPYSLTPTDTGFTGRPSWYIDNGAVQLYMINRMPGTTATATGPQDIAGTGRLLQNGTFYTKFAATYPLFNTKGITDKSVYDYSSINLAAPNFSTVKGETSSLELDQYLLRTQRHTLALQAAWLYERTQTASRAFLGYNDGGRMQTFIDINEKLLDGTPNPYFLRPYLGGSEPAFRKARNNNENYRGTLGYELNLTREQNWVRHLGLHRITGYAEYREIFGGSLGYKDTISSNEPWMTATLLGNRNNASSRAYPRYFVGDANGTNIDYAPSRIAAPTNLTLRYFNGATGQWLNEPVDYTEYYYANRLNKRLLSTTGGTWQAFFWDGRIVPTFGARRDFNRTRDGNSAINPTLATNGFYDQTPMYSFGQNDWVGRHGNTTNAGIVIRPLRWIGLTYSQSNSFSPGSLAYDVYGKPLSDPRGKTKDYGFTLGLFRDRDGSPRLNIIAKQYETLDIGRGSSELNTIVQRAIRLDADGNTTGGDPDLEGFLIQEIQKRTPTATTAEIDAEVVKLMGVDPSYIDGHRGRVHGDGADSYSRGKEVEIAYNPTPFWTLKGTIVQAKSFNSTVSPALQEYIESRVGTWRTIKSPFDGSAYWNGTYRVGNLTPEGWYNQNLIAPTKLAVALQGKPKSQTREWRVNMVTNFKVGGITENRWLKNLDVGGGIRWEDKASIGFFGKTDPDGIIRELDPNRPIWEKSRAYYDFMAGYSFRLLNNRVKTRIQLNVKNVFEKGRLQPIAVNPDGSPWAFRIIDPRQIFLSATFDL
ncbi:MAG TPA: TonB-dependent receptor plug domain-containing protein [Opitutaceae bacterium]|nr:TonB-dependent receptor plug domain-containing protein [Opitutaceae bacterium]